MSAQLSNKTRKDSQYTNHFLSRAAEFLDDLEVFMVALRRALHKIKDLVFEAAIIAYSVWLIIEFLIWIAHRQ